MPAIWCCDCGEEIDEVHEDVYEYDGDSYHAECLITLLKIRLLELRSEMIEVVIVVVGALPPE